MSGTLDSPGLPLFLEANANVCSAAARWHYSCGWGSLREWKSDCDINGGEETIESHCERRCRLLNNLRTHSWPHLPVWPLLVTDINRLGTITQWRRNYQTTETVWIFWFSYSAGESEFDTFLPPGWSTVAPPMLAFLYCFAQVGLEWNSQPPWVTLTLQERIYTSRRPEERAESTALSSRSLHGEAGSWPPRLSSSARAKTSSTIGLKGCVEPVLVMEKSSPGNPKSQ